MPASHAGDACATSFLLHEKDPNVKLENPVRVLLDLVRIRASSPQIDLEGIFRDLQSDQSIFGSAIWNDDEDN